MSVINDFFDKVLVINLKSRQQRFNKTDAYLKKHNIEYEVVEGIDGAKDDKALSIYDKVKNNPLRDFEENKKRKVVTPGKIGCLMSHIKCYQMIKDNGWDRTLIFEDDIVFCKDFDKRIQILDHIPDDWKLIYLGASDYRYRFNRERSINNKKWPYYYGYGAAGRFAYGIKQIIIDDILSLYQDESQWDIPGDVILKQMQSRKSLFFYPNIVIADVRTSDLRESRDMNEHAEKLGWKLSMFDIDGDYEDKVSFSDDFKKEFISSKIKPNFYESIHGWFDFQDIYQLALSRVNGSARFVEVGAYKGKSTAFMAVNILNSGKDIQFDVVDNFIGRTGQIMDNDYLYNVFNHNMQLVSDVINLYRKNSSDAAKKYQDESIDFVFIDARHDPDSVRSDINSWLPKVKKGGIIAGHDYTDKWPGVTNTVDELLPGRQIIGNSWIYIK